MSNAAAIVYPPAIVEQGTTWFQLGKLWLMHHVGLEKDALHVYFALSLLFGSILLFRWSIRSWKPYALIVALAIAGEAWDIPRWPADQRAACGQPAGKHTRYLEHDILAARDPAAGAVHRCIRCARCR